MSFAFFPLYTGDYLRDTRHLSPLKHGVYLMLLMHSWDQQGPLPLDEQECAGIANCRSADEVDALRYVLERFFVHMEDGWYNHRMQRELERASAISNKRKSAGAKGYQAKAKHLLSKSQASATTLTPTPTTTPTPSPTPSPTWSAYASAYASRWHTEPSRNAQVNSQIKQFVSRIGPDAPQVAEFYVSHNDRYYVLKRHPVGMLLKDAEGLHTQWKTGARSTSLEARSSEAVDSAREQLRRLKSEA